MARTEREFLDAVDALGDAHWSAEARELIKQIRAKPTLEIRFDASEERHDLFKVYAKDTDIWLATVDERRDIWLEYYCAENAGHAETAAIFRAFTGGGGRSRRIADDERLPVDILAKVATGPAAAVSGSA